MHTHTHTDTHVHPPIHPFIHSSIHPSIHSSIHPPTHPPIHQSIHPSAQTYISMEFILWHWHDTIRMQRIDDNKWLPLNRKQPKQAIELTWYDKYIHIRIYISIEFILWHCKKMYIQKIEQNNIARRHTNIGRQTGRHMGRWKGQWMNRNKYTRDISMSWKFLKNVSHWKGLLY